MKKNIIRYSTLLCLLLSAMWFAHEPNWHAAILSIGLLAGFIRSDDFFTSRPRLSGSWKYTVLTSENKLSHSGDCQIHQDGDTIKITGKRKFFCSLDSGRRMRLDGGSIPWWSDWCQICNDNVLRFHYWIDIPVPGLDGQKVQGFCRVELDERIPKELTGKYYTLPPFGRPSAEWGPIITWGTITFKKVDHAVKLTAPRAEESEAKDEAESILEGE